MGWGKLGALFSLKALLLACLLAPVPVTAFPTAGYAQFRIVIPGFGIYRGGRRYGRGYRSGRRSARRGRDSESRAGASAVPGEATPARGARSGGKVRGTVD